MLNVQVREPEVARERPRPPLVCPRLRLGAAVTHVSHGCRTDDPRAAGLNPVLSPSLLGGRGPGAGFGGRRWGSAGLCSLRRLRENPSPGLFLTSLGSGPPCPPSASSHLSCHTASPESHAPSASLCKDVGDYRQEPPGYPEVTSPPQDPLVNHLCSVPFGIVTGVGDQGWISLGPLLGLSPYQRLAVIPGA